jgi:aspartyl-tRNA(Asn)/glutamyl-tRNA(Gln) amidotransferase subunit A
LTAVPRLTARAIRADVASGRVSAVDVCRASLERAAQARTGLNAFNLIAAEAALARAASIDAQRSAGHTLGPLAGVPIALKDNICAAGMRTTASSRILETYVPPYDATVVQRLEAADAVIIGKTNCDEFAMGSSNENSAYGLVRNPWAMDYAPGGSSGGSAAAVAAGVAPIALGSDTGGSIRQPASFCGIVGLKPTYGRVSRYGLLAFASSLDQIGPLAHSAADAALVLQVIAGADPADATSAAIPVPDFSDALTGSVEGLRIGVPHAFIAKGVDAPVRGAFDGALEALTRAGATVVNVELPHARYAVPAYYLVCTAEASSNLARYDGVRYGYRSAEAEGLSAMYCRSRDDGFGAEVKRRIMLGTYVLSAGYYDAYYVKAQQVRTLLRRDYEQAFLRADVIAMPTSPTPAFRLGEKTNDPLQMYLADIFTVSANLAGLPGISVPCGFANAGADGTRLPIGLQLIGRMFDEATLLQTADAFERLTDWHLTEPPDRTGGRP